MANKHILRLAGLAASMALLLPSSAVAQESVPGDPLPLPVPEREPVPEPESEPVLVPVPVPVPVPEPLAAPAPVLVPTPPADTKEKKKKKKKKGEIQMKGRVFVRDVLNRQRIGGQTYWRNRHEVSSARPGMNYRHGKGFKAQIELEIARKTPKIKDAYIRIKLLKGLKLQAGRFKRQMSGVALASRWDLPSIERGLLSTLDIPGLPFSGGRGEGAMLTYKLPVPMEPTFSASFFRSELGAGIVIDPRDDLAEDLYLRATIEPQKGLQLASSLAFIGYLGSGSDTESFDHAPIVSAEMSYIGEHLHAWAEGFYGRSTLISLRDAQINGRFLAARALVAPRFRTGTPRRLIPFVGASYLDPRRDDAADSTLEVQGGVNLAFTKIWRLQVEVTHNFSQGDFSPAIDGTALRLQLGTYFKE